MKHEVLEKVWKRMKVVPPSIYVFFLNCKNYQKSANDSQNLPTHGFQVPSDSKNPPKTIILTKITMNFFGFLKNGVFSKNQFVSKTNFFFCY